MFKKLKQTIQDLPPAPPSWSETVERRIAELQMQVRALEIEIRLLRADHDDYEAEQQAQQATQPMSPIRGSKR